MSSIALYLPTLSKVHGLHPLTKLTLLGSIFVAALVTPSTWLVLFFYFFALMPLAAWAKVLQSFLSVSGKAIAPFAFSLFLIQGFFGQGETILLIIGPFGLKAEGLQTAALVSSRILIALSCTTLLLFTTRPDKLMYALVARGLPRQIAYIILTTLQIIPHFQNKANIILDAQQSRGLEIEGSLWRRARALFPLVIPLLLGTIISVDERAIALEARAFSRPGPRTSLIELEDSLAQYLLRRSLMVALLAVILIRIWGPGA